MMILVKNGVDLLEIERMEQAIQRHGSRFLKRVFTSVELEECAGRPESLAARFAAKEAVSKALGTGIGIVGWLEIEVLRDPAGQPLLTLRGNALRLAREQGLESWTVSLSHTRKLAIAFVTAAGLRTS
jgi:holo-[acyl-carrier protein] synthase